LGKVNSLLGVRGEKIDSPVLKKEKNLGEGRIGNRKRGNGEDPGEE